MPQITTYLTPDVHAAVVAYARQFGLDVGALANLLFHRELRVGRLPSLADSNDGDVGTANVKITSHQTDAYLHDLWRDHAKAHGLSISRAGALIFRDELKRQWLKEAVNQVDSK